MAAVHFRMSRSGQSSSPVTSRSTSQKSAASQQAALPNGKKTWNFRVARRMAQSSDLPDGRLSESRVQPVLQKYFTSPVGQIISTSSRHPVSKEGRIAIVTDAGWDAVDAAASGAIGDRRAGLSCERAAGARTNGASTPWPKLRWAAHGRSKRLAWVASYGEVVWSWHPLLMLNRRRSVGPTGLTNLNPLLTVTRRIRRRGATVFFDVDL